MAFQKRFDRVSNGHQIPGLPRVPSSAKGKRSARKKVEDNQMSAFDLLATLAGKLLEEREGFWTPTKDLTDNESPFKGGVFDQGSCDESAFAPPFVSHGQISVPSKRHSESLEARIAAYAPTHEQSYASENDAMGKKLFACGSMGEFAIKSIHSTSPMESCVCKVDNGTVIPLHGKRKTSGSLIYDDAKKVFNIEGTIDLDRKPPVLISSDSSVELPPYGDCLRSRSSSFPSTKEEKELHGDKDDGENSSVCTHPSNVHSKAFKPQCLEAHRKRKLMKSNYTKADPEIYNDGELSNDDVKVKPVFRNRKLFYTRQRTQRSSFKRKKLFDRCSLSPSCGTSRDEALLDSLEKNSFRLEAANKISCTRKGSDSLYDLEDHPVKLSIKSFKVPELFIEIPANATVGSLKRTVMEAVMTVLGDGLRVGVLLQGKKVRDDNKTLRQAGISYEDKIDGLGFTLEPSPAGTPPPHNNLEESGFILCDPEPLNKFQPTDFSLQPTPITILTTNCVESDRENSVHLPVDPLDKKDSFSKALIPLETVNSAAELSIVPYRKSRRSEIAQQRRIRRPFSVSEVEALVQAVEKLGTGRWRDVKLRAFDTSKHRTYVDLKDKWKTLVHTARISPQQRRGEPVPQVLLDRVLSAHSYWSHQQSKLPDPAEPLLLT